MSSEWTGPTPVAQEYPRTYTEHDKLAPLIDRITALKRDLRESTSNLLGTAGIFVTKLGMRIASSLTVEGSLDVTGNMALTGTLSLPAGIIDNDALAHPIIFDGTYNEADTFAIPTTYTEIVSASFVVPAGFTTMKFEAIGSAQVGNTSAGTQYIYLRPRRKTNGVITNSGTRQLVLLAAGGWDSIIAPYIFTDTVTPGDTVTFTLEVYASTTALAAHASNTVRLEVALTFAR